MNLKMLSYPQIPLLFLGVTAVLIFLLARFLRVKNTVMALITAGAFLLVSFYLLYEAHWIRVLELCTPNFPNALTEMFTEGAFTANDPAAVLIGVVACGLVFLISLYCVEYLKFDRRQHVFYPLLILMMCGLLGMLFADDLMVVYLFCELMSICAYALVAFRRKIDVAIEAGFKYLIMGSVASVVLLMGIALIFQSAGTVDLSKVEGTGNLFAQIGMIMLLASFSLKSALVPLHTWLPDAHGRAPSSISAVLSGVLVQGVFYTMLRICLALGMDRFVLGSYLLALSLLNILVGNLVGLVQTHTKRLLGYSTIAQMGYIGLCFALGLRNQSLLALQSGFFLIVAHAIAKSLAFLVQGVFYYYLDASQIVDLQRAGRLPYFFSLAFGISVLSLAAIPPLPGFMGKWIFLTSVFAQIDAWSMVGVIALLVGSLISLGYYFKILQNLFFRPAPPMTADNSANKQKVSVWMLIPVAGLVFSIVMISITPHTLLDGTGNAAQYLMELMK